MRRARAALVATALLAGVASACSGPPAAPAPTTSSSPASSFVARSGAQLTVDGHAYRFLGYNLYDAASTDAYSCDPGHRLDESALRDLLTAARDRAGATVVRFWAYQTYTAGGTDWSGVDRVLRVAKDLGMRVLPVLEDGPGDCSTGPVGTSLAEVDGGTYYTDGYRKPLGTARISLREYAAAIAAHYRDEPAIVGWTLVNEAETTQRAAGDTTPLAAFARDLASVVHAADPDHLVTLGSQSNGAPGASGKDFAAVYDQSGIDFAEAHDWNRYGDDTAAIPGATAGSLPDAESGPCQRTDSPIACSFAIARAKGIPMVVGEAGIQATDTDTRTRRATLLGSKIAAAFSAGVSGYVVWQLKRDNSDGTAVDATGEDPLLRVTAQASAGLG